jgi:hypothetical protein
MRREAIVAVVVLFFLGWLLFDEEPSMQIAPQKGCHELLNQEYMALVFEKSEPRLMSSYKQEGFDQRHCSYDFHLHGRDYEASLTLDRFGDGTQEQLEEYLGTFEDRRFLMGVGDKAYIYSVGLSEQMSILKDGYLLHGYVIEEREEGLFFDKELTKQLLYAILERLALS